MAIRSDALEAMEKARRQAPEVIRTFMRVRGITQEQLGEAIGLTQTQMSRRLREPGSTSHDEMIGLAAVFGVSVGTFYKPIPEALADLFTAPAPVTFDEATPQNEAKGASVSSAGIYRLDAARSARATAAAKSRQSRIPA